MSTITPQSLAEGDTTKAAVKKILACVLCQQRKIKCDRATPSCGSCKRSGAQCVPVNTLGPRQRRRRFPERELLQRLRHYENLLKKHKIAFEPLHGADATKSQGDTHDHADASDDDHDPDDDSQAKTDGNDKPARKVDMQRDVLQFVKSGKLLTGKPGRTRYVDSHFLRDLDIGDGDDWQRLSDDEADRDYSIVRSAAPLALDPLTGALMSPRQSLLHMYPNHTEAMSLLRTHLERVEPLTKILHIPALTAIFQTAVSKPADIDGKAESCVFFAVCHFAAYALTELECTQIFGPTLDRAAVMQKYHFASWQSLVNVKFLKTTEFMVLQALVLLLMPLGNVYDPQTYWILTGVAARISTRLGLHRDGEKQGLPPFDVQMRRRLAFQIIPLDGKASHHAGVGMGLPPNFDTQSPINTNDAQLWPGMSKPPEEQKGATEMIYCRARSHIGRFFAKQGKLMMDGDATETPNIEEFDRSIDVVESEVEETYLRYCDVVDPLHFLTICSARSAIAAMRLRIRLAQDRANALPEAERKRAWELALKIMDTDAAASSNTSLRRFAWHMRSFFVWGSWDSLIFLLASLRKNNGTLSPGDVNAAWTRIEATYTHHAELVEQDRALPEAVGRVTLKAFEASPPTDRFIEPSFITTLRTIRQSKAIARAAKDAAATPSLTDSSTITSPSDLVSPGVSNALESYAGTMDFDMNADYNVGSADDWAFWDQMIRDYQALPDLGQAQFGQQTF
ncbi:hypothetical protein B0A48_10192 [Cryoendolithus antarcticus]|uniref:Zn(2)-C6 fungal-type domain-containing protein n=1 Tax=Cryoendolithus antarcticus TaxID=1507870 RepID=A0A1V8SX23_9PEZI|nr:hypothetical protein B0A48_10192 [Cryoendolithus antarcticus]